MTTKQKYSIQLVMRSQAGMQIVTYMTPLEVRNRLFNEISPSKYITLECINEVDEPVEVVVDREQLDAYIVGPFHPRTSRPGIVS